MNWGFQNGGNNEKSSLTRINRYDANQHGLFYRLQTKSSRRSY